VTSTVLMRSRSRTDEHRGDARERGWSIDCLARTLFKVRPKTKSAHGRCTVMRAYKELAVWKVGIAVVWATNLHGIQLRRWTMPWLGILGRSRRGFLCTTD
jgi:hypothetical protein